MFMKKVGDINEKLVAKEVRNPVLKKMLRANGAVSDKHLPVTIEQPADKEEPQVQHVSPRKQTH